MEDRDFELDLEELSSAEDFLEYFQVSYEPAVVHVNRLHILQRFHDYIGRIEHMPLDDREKYKVYNELLKTAYNDFVKSDAVTEKVFKVFRMNEPSVVTVPLTDLGLNRQLA